MSLLKKSEKFTQEYCGTIVKIGQVIPIENSDFLAKTFINFEPIVVRKDQVKEGDVMFYVSNECQINEKFLSVNNLFEFGSRELNANYQEVEEMLNTDEKKAKRMVGFFAKTGRVRAIRLRQQLSMGYLFGKEEMTKYNDKAKDLVMEDHIGEDFDMVGDEVFVKAYVPLNKKNEHVSTGNGRRNKKLKKLERLIPGEFALHYNTNPLKRNVRKINVSDSVSISCKIHGTSGIFANVKVKNYFKLPLHKRIWNKVCDWVKAPDSKIIDYTIGYGDVYSSRNVVKNANYNPNVTGGFYGSNDVWGEWNEILKNHIQQGMTVYGEIVGYVPGTTKMIQKDYDYGCQPGESKFMPYRITQEVNDGKKYEYEVCEVKEWAEHLIKETPELKDKIMVIPILFQGKLTDLYPEVPIDEDWHEHILLKMEEDKEHFGMEEDEPLCKFHPKSPREGVVIRINKDPLAEAFKLKCQNFLSKERKAIDNGEVDMEMEANTEEEPQNE